MDDVTLENRLYSADQMRAIDDEITKRQFHHDSFPLMQRAGDAAYAKIVELYSTIKNIVIFCGQGNNGGDGFVVARLAAEQGYSVKVFFLGIEALHSAASKKAYQQYQSAVNQCQNAQLIPCKNQEWENSLDQHQNTLYIDAIFGIGLNKAPDGFYKKAINFINTKKNIVALDIPSGLQADSGEVYGACVKAHHTITFIALKQGLFTSDGPDYCGKLHLATLNIDTKIVEKLEYNSWLMDHEFAKKIIHTELPPRAKNSHKHQFGHVVIIGGGRGMPGAVLMAGLAAMRVGAGLVTLITDSQHSSEINNSQPELMAYGVDENSLTQQKIKEELSALITKATVVIIGPGMGLTPWAQKLFSYSMEHIFNSNTDRAVLIDADGLTLLSEMMVQENFSSRLKAFAPSKLILTPHPGEAKKLLHKITSLPKNSAVKESRFNIATAIADSYNAITVLKGCGSLIARQNLKIAICPYGNPGMSTAGSGDILSGIIAGLIAQKLDNYTAACLGVYLHATAGDRCAQKNGERGLIATDLLEEIRRLLN